MVAAKKAARTKPFEKSVLHLMSGLVCQLRNHSIPGAASAPPRIFYFTFVVRSTLLFDPVCGASA